MATQPATDPLAELRAAVVGATAILDREAGEKLTLERPPKPELGDYSTNAAMLLAPTAGAPPREVAERLRTELDRILGDSVERIEVAGPGFLNVFLSDRWHRQATADLLAAGERLALTEAAEPERVLVEFVSANPTGPVTAASGRGAAYGDTLASLLEHAGHGVEREYYLNDAGTQVGLFAQSIAARMRGEQPPEEGYAGRLRRRAGDRAGRGRRRSGRPRGARPARDRGDAGADRGDAGALRCPLRHLVVRA